MQHPVCVADFCLISNKRKTVHAPSRFHPVGRIPPSTADLKRLHLTSLLLLDSPSPANSIFLVCPVPSTHSCPTCHSGPFGHVASSTNSLTRSTPTLTALNFELCSPGLFDAVARMRHATAESQRRKQERPAQQSPLARSSRRPSFNPTKPAISQRLN